MSKTINLKVENLSKAFARADSDVIINALSNINFELVQGEFVSLVGASGCGKSTLLRLIAGLLKPTVGSVKVNGRKVEGPDPSRGMVFQQTTLFPWLTVEQNLNFSFKLKGMKKSAYEVKTAEMLEIIGLAEFKDSYPEQLSGGMAQRVDLARSLISEPEILLLDEPLGALDAFTRMNMQDEILALWEKNRQLVVMVTHDVDEAVYMGSKVIVMNSNPGRIKAELSIDLDYPRNRSSALFVEYRNQILDILHYGVKE